MDKAAEKLFLEYSKKTYLDWEAIGREDAKVWVELASLEDLEGLFHNIATHKRKGDEPGPFFIPASFNRSSPLWKARERTRGMVSKTG